MPEATGGQAVVRTLKINGVEVVMGIPGTHTLPIFDALLDSGIRTIQVRHEQTAAFMADGYARVTGKPGVLLTITGPGALNATAAIGTAYFDSSPIFTISANVQTHSLDKARGTLHETKDQWGVFKAITKWAGRSMAVKEIPESVDHAFREMLNGRPLPTYLEIPTDVLYAKEDVEEIPWMAAPATRARTGPDPELIASATEQIAKSKRPIIWAGGGVIRAEASPELVALAELIGAPVVTTTQGRGAIPGDHPLAIVAHPSSLPVAEWLASADLLVAIGTRFSEEATAGWKVRVPKNLVHIDIDPEEVGKNYPVNVGIIGDAKLSLRALAEALKPAGARPARSDEAAQVNRDAQAYFRGKDPVGPKVLDEIRAAIPRDGIIVADSTRVAYWATLYMPFYAPRTYVYPGYGTLGGGFPTALGAKLGAPDKPVVALCGDGGFQYSFPDLSTAVQANLNIVVLLVNDGKYGVLVEQQDEMYGRRSGVELTNPDFGGIVRSYGLNHIALDDWDGVGDALKRAMANDRLTVVEVKKGIQSPPWGME